MTEDRKPAAFPLSPPAPVRDEDRPEPRRPRAMRGEDLATVRPAEIDVFDIDPAEADAAPAPLPPKRRSRLGGLFMASVGILLSMAVGLWVDGLVRDLFARADWLGWVALVVAVVAFVALAVIIGRELAGMARLASVDRLRSRALAARDAKDAAAARATVDELARFLQANPRTAAGRRALDDLRHDVIDAPDLIRLAETELLAPLDLAAQALILDAGKRVSMVTAISPRAVVDLAYVLYESARLVRRIAELYGARPGTIGFVRLARAVLAHLAVTGTLAAGDGLVQQIVGHGLAARLSAKLGEGVVNGMMTVRIGVAAMETVRPLPFDAVGRPGLGDFLGAIARFARKRSEP